MPQHRRVGEAGARRDRVDAQVGLFEQPAGQQHPLPGQPVVRRGTRLRAEPPRERAWRHVCPARHRVDVHRPVQVLDQPAEHRFQRRRVGCLR